MGVEPCEPTPPGPSCEWAPWGQWAGCSVECGGGQRGRTRGVTSRAGCNGGCSNEVVSTQACNTAACQPCVWSSWSAWGECSASCGGGLQGRTRSVATPAGAGGALCTGGVTSVQSCNTNACPGESHVTCTGSCKGKFPCLNSTNLVSAWHTDLPMHSL